MESSTNSSTTSCGAPRTKGVIDSKDMSVRAYKQRELLVSKEALMCSAQSEPNQVVNDGLSHEIQEALSWKQEETGTTSAVLMKNLEQVVNDGLLSNEIQEGLRWKQEETGRDAALTERRLKQVNDGSSNDIQGGLRWKQEETGRNAALMKNLEQVNDILSNDIQEGCCCRKQEEPRRNAALMKKIMEQINHGLSNVIKEGLEHTGKKKRPDGTQR
jgi:hypothetical protein